MAKRDHGDLDLILDADDIDDSLLEGDHLLEVKEAVVTLRTKAYSLGLALGVSSSDLDAIHSKHSDPDKALTEVLQKWLKQGYNVTKYGIPSWRSLVKAVGNPAGGDHQALAKNIAASHPVSHDETEVLPLKKHRKSSKSAVETAMTKTIEELQERIEQQESTLKWLQEEVVPRPPVTLTVPIHVKNPVMRSVQQDQKAKDTFTIEPKVLSCSTFYTHLHRGYKLAVILKRNEFVKVNSGHIYTKQCDLFIAFLALSQNDDEQRPWPCKGKIKVEMSETQAPQYMQPFEVELSIDKPNSRDNTVIPNWHQVCTESNPLSNIPQDCDLYDPKVTQAIDSMDVLHVKIMNIDLYNTE